MEITPQGRTIRAGSLLGRKMAWLYLIIWPERRRKRHFQASGSREFGK
jgi:hypothetical protein